MDYIEQVRNRIAELEAQLISLETEQDFNGWYKRGHTRRVDYIKDILSINYTVLEIVSCGEIDFPHN